MIDVIQYRLIDHFKSYDAYIASLTEEQLHERLQPAKHKSVAEHLWCVLGARESYTKALVHGQWQGFACSVDGKQLSGFQTGFQASATTLEAAWVDLDWTPDRQSLLLDLLEHEVMHQGQLIRHAHALGHPLPSSWHWA